MDPSYSFVIPVHDEADSIPLLVAALEPVLRALDGEAEIILVDDGSTDGSLSLLVDLHERDERFKVLHLARNFGHQVAVTAGLDLARGDAVITMDADLQDPPEVVLTMVERWADGFDIVYGHRTDRAHDTWLKRNSAAAYYRLLGRVSSVDIPREVGDFRLMDRAVVETLRSMHERNRYLRGMVASLGFRQTTVDYARPARQAGTTSYTARRMVRLASDGIVGFSKLPLHLTLGLGIAAGAVGSAAGLAVGASALAGRSRTPALERVAVVGLGLGTQLVAIGALGEYVGRIYDESLARPLYTVRSAHGFAETDQPAALAAGSSTVPVIYLTEGSRGSDRRNAWQAG